MNKDSKTLREEPTVWDDRKRLGDFLPLVVNLEAEGQTSRAEVVQYLISRAMVAEANLESAKKEAREEAFAEAAHFLEKRLLPLYLCDDDCMKGYRCLLEHEKLRKDLSNVKAMFHGQFLNNK